VSGVGFALIGTSVSLKLRIVFDDLAIDARVDGGASVRPDLIAFHRGRAATRVPELEEPRSLDDE
jgi:hypothetical protein